MRFQVKGCTFPFRYVGTRYTNTTLVLHYVSSGLPLSLCSLCLSNVIDHLACLQWYLILSVQSREHCYVLAIVHIKLRVTFQQILIRFVNLTWKSWEVIPVAACSHSNCISISNTVRWLLLVHNVLWWSYSVQLDVYNGVMNILFITCFTLEACLKHAPFSWQTYWCELCCQEGQAQLTAVALNDTSPCRLNTLALLACPTRKVV